MNVLANLARVTTATAGTGTLTLGAAVAGFLTFAQAGLADGSVVTYAIEDANGGREIGRGTYTLTGTTLSRDLVYRSTGAGNTAKITCSGSAQVFLSPAAEDLASLAPLASPVFTGLLSTTGGGVRPASSAGPGFALGTNYSGFAAEVDFWNTANTGNGFNFIQKTGAAAETTLATLGPLGLTLPTISLGVGMTPPSGVVGLAVATGGVLRLYNTFTDASNGEWGGMQWAANALQIGSNQNGTGVARDVSLLYGGVEKLRLAAAGVNLTTLFTSSYNGPAARPASTAGSGFALSSNYTGTYGEVDFWNTRESPGGGFFFYQKTGAAAETAVGILNLGGLLVTAGLVGTTAAGNAPAGNIGEVISAEVAFNAALALTTLTWRNVTSISLTAGDWDVWGSVAFYSSTGTTTISRQAGSIGTTSAAPDLSPAGGAYVDIAAAMGTGLGASLPVGQRRINVSTTTTVYLMAFATFGVSTLGAYGGIYARRRR